VTICERGDYLLRHLFGDDAGCHVDLLVYKTVAILASSIDLSIFGLAISVELAY